MGAVASIFGGKPKPKPAPPPPPPPPPAPPPPPPPAPVPPPEPPPKTEQAGATAADGMTAQRRRATSQRSQLRSPGSTTRGGINIPGGS